MDILLLFKGVLFATAAAVVAPWFPLTEMSTACAIYTAGTEISTITSNYFSSLLCQSHFLNGWPAIFYIFGK